MAPIGSRRRARQSTAAARTVGLSLGTSWPGWLAAGVRLFPSLFALLAVAAAVRAADNSVLGPDSQPQPVSHGAVRQGVLATSRIYPGTTHDYIVYVPKQYRPERPACLMVFFDGGGFMKDDGTFRVPVVFDNLIAKGEMPVTTAVAGNPGVVGRW